MNITRCDFLREIACMFLMLTTCLHANFLESGELPKDYSHLVEIVQDEKKEAPFYAFNDFAEEFDQDAHDANLEYFNNHAELVEKIRGDLDGGNLQWKLDNFKQRLLFVPELRNDYAVLYQNYCNDIINYVLDKAKLDNPFCDIRILLDEKPKISENGITVFLVHNLAKEYVASYAFSNDRNESVKVELAGRIFLGDVGSYTSNLYYKENGEFEFIKDNYTIWRNSARNPYTALMVPAEETLHIVLRKYTEKAIKRSLEIGSVRTIEEVKRISEDWMQVEEAIVGGIVNILLRDYIVEHINNFKYSSIEEDITSKNEFRRYMYLKKGIEVVKNMGYIEAIDMYSCNPMEFRKLLSCAPSAQEVYLDHDRRNRHDGA